MATQYLQPNDNNGLANIDARPLSQPCPLWSKLYVSNTSTPNSTHESHSDFYGADKLCLPPSTTATGGYHLHLQQSTVKTNKACYQIDQSNLSHSNEKAPEMCQNDIEQLVDTYEKMTIEARLEEPQVSNIAPENVVCFKISMYIQKP